MHPATGARRYDPVSREAQSAASTRNTTRGAARSSRRTAASVRSHTRSASCSRGVRARAGDATTGATRGDSAMKVAIYARYSSDNQRDASIADQLRICREFAARQGWTVVQEFTDHAISGATLLRSGFQALMRDALNRRFDVVLAESLGPLQSRPGRHRRSLQASHLRRRQHRHARRRRHHAPAHRVQGDDERAVPEGSRREDSPRTARTDRRRKVGRRPLLRLSGRQDNQRRKRNDGRTGNRTSGGPVVERIFREFIAGVSPKQLPRI